MKECSSTASEAIASSQNAILAAKKVYENIVAAHESVLAGMRLLAERVVWQCAHITGYPRPYTQRVSDVSFDLDEWMVRVTLQGYCGEGHWEDEEDILSFPIRWLDLTTGEYIAEMQTQVAHEKALEAEKRAAEATAEEDRRREHRLEMYRKLKEEFGE
jgi:hypothetical protein